MFESVILSGDLCSWLDRWWHLDVDETMVYFKEHGGLCKEVRLLLFVDRQIVIRAQQNKVTQSRNEVQKVLFIRRTFLIVVRGRSSGYYK